jgi:glycosyltransferase involved in cell wall biosynthesis
MSARTLISVSRPAKKQDRQEAQMGLRPRIEYLALANLIQADVIEGEVAGSKHLLPWQRTELHDQFSPNAAWRARRAIYQARGSYKSVLSMSEGGGLPLAALLIGYPIHHIIQLSNPSRPKIAILNLFAHINKRLQILVLSGVEKQLLTNHGISNQQVIVVHPSVDTRFFNIDWATPNCEAQVDAVVLGRSHRDWGTLLGTATLLKDVQISIDAGSIWETRHGLPERGLPQNVVIKNARGAKAVRDELAEGKIGVLAIDLNTSQVSSGAMTILEMMAMSMPVVVSAPHGFLREVVNDQETGLVVEPGNAIALANAVRYLLNNPEFAKNMGRKARMLVENNYSLDIWLNRISLILNPSMERPIYEDSVHPVK